MAQKIGILGSGMVGDALKKGFDKYGYERVRVPSLLKSVNGRTCLSSQSKGRRPKLRSSWRVMRTLRVKR